MLNVILFITNVAILVVCFQQLLNPVSTPEDQVTAETGSVLCLDVKSSDLGFFVVCTVIIIANFLARMNLIVSEWTDGQAMGDR